MAVQLQYSKIYKDESCIDKLLLYILKCGCCS